MPDSIKYIDIGAFYGCSKLKGVSVPAGIIEIGDRAFKGCKGLADKNGFIIFKDEFHCFEGKQSNVIIPDHITTIREYAFAGCAGVTSITIPDSVVSIGNSAFEECDKQTSITISESVVSIGDKAFENCKKLKDVYYAGDGHSWVDKMRTTWKDSPVRYGATIHIQKGDFTLPLAGLTFVVTGDLKSYPDRDDLKKEIECLGGHLTGSVSGKTNYLITNFPGSYTTKLKKARELNIPVIDETEFLKMAGLK